MGSQRIGRREVLKTVGAVGAASVLAAVSAPQVAQAEEGQNGSSTSPVGSWLERVDADGFVFDVLLTFASGGGLVGTASIDSTVNGDNLLSSPTHGAWVGIGGRSYRWFGKAFAFTNGSDVWDGTYEIKELLTLNERGDQFEGSGFFRIVPIPGGSHSVDGITYTTTGTRIKA